MLVTLRGQRVNSFDNFLFLFYAFLRSNFSLHSLAIIIQF